MRLCIPENTAEASHLLEEHPPFAYQRVTHKYENALLVRALVRAGGYLHSGVSLGNRRLARAI